MRRVRAAAVVLCITGCQPREFSSTELHILETLTGLSAPPADESNAYRSDQRAVELGRVLFFDPHLSGPSSLVDALGVRVPFGRAPAGAPLALRCVDCHDLATGGVDRSSPVRQISVGAGWFEYNAPSAIDASHYRYNFWDGRADSLWAVAIAALEARHAMNGNRLAVARHIYLEHRDAYEAIFGPLPLRDGAWTFPENGKPGADASCQPSEIDPDVFDCLSVEDREAITLVLVNVAKAMAAFEHRLESGPTAFDRHLAGIESMSDEAVLGARLFVGKAACVDCHRTPFFSDQSFHNTGVPELELVWNEVECVARAPCDCSRDDSKSCLPWGRFVGIQKLARSPWRKMEYVEAPSQEAKGAWRTPTLRNVAFTAPYMHAGVFETLEEVVWHYDRGGSASSAASRFVSPAIQPLGLTEGEVRALVSFLEALSGDPLPAELISAPPPH